MRVRISRAGVSLAVLLGSVGAVVAGPVPSFASSSTTLPIQSEGDMLVDAVHELIYLSDPVSDKVVAIGYDGAHRGTVTNLPGVRGLALSADSSRLYAAATDGDAIVAISTASFSESARFPTGAGTDPTHLAVAGDKVWFGYGTAFAGGGLGSLDPAGGDGAVKLGQDAEVKWNSAPLLAATAERPGVLAAADGGNEETTQVKVYDVADGTAKTTATSTALQRERVSDLDFSLDGSRLLTATVPSADVQSWQTADLTLESSWSIPEADFTTAVALSPDGRMAVGTSRPYDADVHVFLPGATTPVRQFDFANTGTSSDGDNLVDRALAWEPNGDRLFAVTDTYGGSLRLQILTQPSLSEAKLTLTVPARTASRGKPVGISGTLTASTALPGGTPITVTRTDSESPAGRSLGTKVIDSKGRFSFTDTPAAGGRITYKVTYAGDAKHIAATASGAVTVPLDATTLTLSGNRVIYAYGTKVTFVAKLGKAYKNRVVEIWADPAGSDQANRLIRKATANSGGVVSVPWTLTRNTTVTAIYRGDTRTAARTVKSSPLARVRISTVASGQYKTAKIGSVKYHFFRKSKNPVFTTTMPAVKNRSQLLSFQVYYAGAWRDAGSGWYKLSTAGKSQITLVGTHTVGDKIRVRSSYVYGSSGDSLNVSTNGAWLYFTFTK